ncbi:MAG TPA: LemA family protein [Candidatus Sulfotelmatobacter sp.]|nr:LemA family protein [Candidatus Sulfotelmatobacter sp.]
MGVLIAVIVIVVVIGGIVAALFNSLVRLNQQADEAWSDITVQLKRRYDLIPNLVNAVKGYASHEKTVFEDVTAARTKALSAQTVTDQAKAENQFQQTMKSLFAVAENYPDLKATQNFQELQSELTDTEDKIQASRRFYNGVVRDFNSKRRTFPTNLFASMLGFNKDKDYFEVDEAQIPNISEPVQVKF